MAKTEIKQNVPVFVSSTYEDLIPYRDEVQRVLIRLEQIVRGMEYFGSSPKNPLEVCIETVKNCKVFVGIIAMRYGSIEEQTKKSFTQLEYEAAIGNQIPTLIYILDENYPIPPKFVDRDEKAEMLSNFKGILTKNHTISYFTTPENLGKKLTSDLLEVLKSLDNIKINYNNSISTKDNFDEIFKKFVLRPARYTAQEGILNVKIANGNKAGGNLRADVIKGMGLTLGDTICVPVFVINKENNDSLMPDFIYLYGEKEVGDWIENVLPGTIAEVKVRLDFFVLKEVAKYDGGSILKNSVYTNLVLLEVINSR